MHALLKYFATFLAYENALPFAIIQTETLQNGQLANLAGLVFIYAILIGFHDVTMLNYITSGV